MTNYKDTINLPKTDFSMKAGLAQREPVTLARWQEMDIYARLRKERAGQEQFILHDGPPYANGAIHIGHAVNKVLKDIIVKSRTLDGLDAPFVPGWDCHGLPIEQQVEKKHGKAGVKLGKAEFRTMCREFAQRQIEGQKEDFKRLGVIGDWDNPYLTMAFETEANTLRALGKIIEFGHLYHGLLPVLWCTECRSALAEAEVEYEDRVSPAIDVRFDVEDVDDFRGRIGAGTEDVPNRVSVVIWTTTPWTLPANEAVALHPELDYVVVSAGDGDWLVLAEALSEEAMERYGLVDYRVLARFAGEVLEGLRLSHPFYDRKVPVVLGEYVTTEAGTGAVHTAPGHGPDDFVVGKKYGLPVNNPVGPDGVFLDSTELFGGHFVFKANEVIVDVLRVRARLLSVTDYEHSYPHCWRHGKPIIFRATAQWFIGMERAGLRQKALACIDEVSWLPDWGHARIRGMVENRPDWCVSRQRIWGSPIALYAHRETGELHPDTQNILEQVAQRIEKMGIDAWFELDDRELIPDDVDQYDKVADTLDVWFDSGTTHDSVLARRADLHRPADLYLEGSDQHRGWFQSSLLTGVAMVGKAPYKAVLTHGFTVDAEGRKMSKSRGNVIAPQKVFDTLGADVLRLWVAGSDYRSEMTISDEVLKRIADSYRRIRNTARYLLGNLDGFHQEQALPYDEMLALDQWAVRLSASIDDEVRSWYTSYQFHQIYQRMHQFCAVEMGGFYLDVLKDRLYTTPAGSRARLSAQTAMYHTLEAMVRWIAPILSFTGEEIWQHMSGEREDSVLLTTWYDGLPATDSGANLTAREGLNDAFWSDVIAVRGEVGKRLEELRVDGKIGAGLDAEVDLYCDNAWQEKLGRLGDELHFVFITSAARVLPLESAPGDAIDSAIEGVRLAVFASTHEKCVRCWHRCADIRESAAHPELCARCIENVDGAGEDRRYA